MIFNFDYVFFFWRLLPFHWNLFISLSQCDKRNLKFVIKNSQKTPFLWPINDSLVALTQCDELVLRKWQKKAKKGDMVNIEHHSIMRIILVDLLVAKWITPLFVIVIVISLSQCDKGNIRLVTKTLKKKHFCDQLMIPLSHWLSATK